MLDPVGNLPFAVEAQRSRESIENHQAQQQVQVEHNRAHKLSKALERQQLDLMLSYDKFGASNSGLKPQGCLLYTSPSPRDGLLSRMPSSA